MSMIKYQGHLGYNNIGDEAIYLGCQQLFNSNQLMHCDEVNNQKFTLYGGGTILPHQSKRVFQKSDSPNIGIGLGVRYPEFWNSPSAPIDLRYYLGRLGIDGILDNRVIDWALKPLTHISNSIDISKYYIDESMFKHLSEFDHLGVRGPLSYDVLNRYGIESRITGDTALILEPTEYISDRTSRVGITLRNSGRKFSQDTSYRKILVEFLQEYSGNYEFVLLPQQPRDIPLHLELAQLLPNATVKDYCSYVDVQGIIDEYAKCDIVIGEKLHANVLSACAHTPFISLAYQRKHMDFAESINMTDYNLNKDDLTINYLQQKFMEINGSDKVKDRLKQEVTNKRNDLREYRDVIYTMVAN